LQNCGRRFRKECRRCYGRELLKLQPPTFAFFETRY
jgi:hypothetical protein